MTRINRSEIDRLTQARDQAWTAFKATDATDAAALAEHLHDWDAANHMLGLQIPALLARIAELEAENTQLLEMGTRNQRPPKALEFYRL